MLTEKQIEQNWLAFMSIIEANSPDPDIKNRWNTLYNFYDDNANRIATIPASAKASYHNAFPGGYIDHVLRVYKLSLDFYYLWSKYKNLDFTKEELIFVALNHDLGKIGSLEHEYYIPQDSKWHYERGEYYKNNPELSFMKVSDRSIFLLQQIGVPFSEKEYLGIKLHDGLYEESNKSYYIAYSQDYKLKSDLPYVIHQADLTATRLESDENSLKIDFSTEIKVDPTEKQDKVEYQKDKTVKKSSKAISKFLNE